MSELSERIDEIQMSLGKLTYRLYREGVLNEEQVREFEELESDIRIEAVSKIEALEAKLSKMKRERDLYRQLAIFKDAKSISFGDQYDYGLAIYTLRDLPLTEEFELRDLAWAHHAEGNTSKGDWEYFRDEWLKRWREALAGGDDEKSKRLHSGGASYNWRHGQSARIDN